MTYLGWVGTYKAQSCRHAASTVAERSPLMSLPLSERLSDKCFRTKLSERLFATLAQRVNIL